MCQNSYKLIQQHPSYLNYDVSTNKLYLVDLAGLGPTDPNSRTSFPIDEESPYVEAFNLWREPYGKPEKDPGETRNAPPSDDPVKKPPPEKMALNESRPPDRY